MGPGWAEDPDLLLNPNAAIRMAAYGKDPDYVYPLELEEITLPRPNHLALVFDQSSPRGGERQSIVPKVHFFRQTGICEIRFVAQTSFVLLGANSSLVRSSQKAV